MLRLFLVVLLTSLLGSGGVAAALVANVPVIVELFFIGCLTLFVVALARGALTTSTSDRARAHAGSAAAPVGAVGLAQEKRGEREASEQAAVPAS
jgi:uncharacterized membrane protein YtjA (UPF0391 family)